MSTSPSETPGRERGPHELFCRNCGAVIDREAEICPSCGVRQRPPPKSSVDSALDDLLEGGNPFVAAVLSALFPGLGQIYNRELERGLVFVVATIFAAFSTLVFVGFILFPAVWLFAIYDAYTRAELRAEELRSEEHAREPSVSESVTIETAAQDEAGEAVEAVDEAGEAGETVDEENEAGETVDEENEAGETVDEENETGETVDEENETGETVDEENETGETVDEENETDETDESSSS